jgi:hypothetical protein
MPPKCSICIHDQKQEINRALIAGEPFRIIAERFGTSATALHRHKGEHLPKTLTQAKEVQNVADADDLLAQLRALRNRAISILQKAEAAGDFRTALAGIREARGCVETLMEVEGELDRRGTVNVIVNPQWIAIRDTLFEALQDFPEARQKAAAAIQATETGARDADAA